MKNGKPSLFFDIRYYLDSDPAHHKNYFELQAYGRRLAWLLNARGMSFGSFDTLTFLTDKKLTEQTLGEVGTGENWWFRNVYVGSHLEFKDEQKSLEAGREATLTALRQLCPDKSDQIDGADKIAMSYGESLRFVVRSKDYAKYRLELATNISAHPSEDLYFALITEKPTGDVVEVGPIQSGIYLLAKAELAGVGIRDFEVKRDDRGDLCASSSLGQIVANGSSRYMNESLYVSMVKRGPA
ncbi:MAG: hypothetical protein OXD48_08300 [Litoreibacter sp.]|nr:hypothetical protein [Litoreibacter sp.]